MSPPLLDRIVEEIDRVGPIGFDRFMDLALYDPEAGFYAGGGGSAGRRGGDFITSVEVGPLFGAVIGRALDAWWDELGSPDPFPVIEGGAGRGALAASVLRSAPRCGAALVWVLVERSAGQRAVQRELVSAWADRCRHVGDLDDAPAAVGMEAGSVRGVVIANELLDNLPVRLCRRRAAGWDELRVVAAPDGTLGWGSGPVDPSTVARLGRLVPDPRVDAVVPLADAARRWVAAATSMLSDGRVLLLDYGDPTERLARRPVHEWLRTYREHGTAGDPLAEPGTKDVTCEVPIDQLDVPAPDEVVSQRDFLVRHGIGGLVEEGRQVWAERAHLGDLRALEARSRVGEAEALCDPGSLGAFRALLFPATGAAGGPRPPGTGRG